MYILEHVAFCNYCHEKHQKSSKINEIIVENINQNFFQMTLKTIE